ncbi:hypothetical protein [Caulobacter sp. RL271]|jgi:hypothetical protein|uniref:Phospholipase n=1 Tax=Caulobacter segnis TaxID=88688 RepID=A0ABY4ZQP1_9CAUL|nr:hypothetical protein [Caulobacter segnis]USQ95000.1 hypothetical protein MZV50_20930 [Caulobacter segnis]
MTRHILFLVHGMGRYGVWADGAYKPDQKSWFEECERELRANYARFIQDTVGAGAAFDDLFVVKPIEYDSILDHFRAVWETQSDAWSQLGVGKGFIGGIQKFFAKNSDDAFLWTHLADVALYMAPTVRAHVQAHVATEITKVLAEALAAGRFSQWSVIAHSLGTAVTHDTVAQLARLTKTTWGKALGPIPSPRALVMVANVARLLTDDAATLYADTLAPVGPRHPTYYISCAHVLDPFTRLAPFKPAWTSPRYRALARLDTYYLAPEVIDLLRPGENHNKFGQVAPHGFKHYLRQPEVTATMWPLLLAEDPADYPGVADAVLKAYLDEQKDALKAKLKPRLDDLLAHMPPADPVLEKLLKLLKGLL